MTAHQGRYAAYYRVSTGRQGASGLGLGAQNRKVQDFLDGGRWQLTASFTEIESGRRDDRPELTKALAYCKRHKDTKLIVVEPTDSRHAISLDAARRKRGGNLCRPAAGASRRDGAIFPDANGSGRRIGGRARQSLDAGNRLERCCIAVCDRPGIVTAPGPACNHT
jgi:hypothetical protein